MSQEFISLAEAAREFPGNPHVNTVKRWSIKGVYGAKLKTARIAGKRLTRRDWLAEFQQAVTQTADTAPPEDSNETESRLDELGVHTNGTAKKKPPRKKHKKAEVER